MIENKFDIIVAGDIIIVFKNNEKYFTYDTRKYNVRDIAEFYDVNINDVYYL